MRVLDEFVEGGHRVLRRIVRPIKLLDVGLKCLPVHSEVPGEKFNRVFDSESTVVWKTGAALSFGEAEVLAFDVPFFEEFRDVFTVDVMIMQAMAIRYSPMDGARSVRILFLYIVPHARASFARLQLCTYSVPNSP